MHTCIVERDEKQRREIDECENCLQPAQNATTSMRPPTPTPNLSRCTPPSLPDQIAAPSSSRAGWALRRQQEGLQLLLLVLALATPEEKEVEER